MKTSKQIRKEFIEFFKNKNHTFVPSWPTIPMNDPTLLFTNAGMNQFKNRLLGAEKTEFSRAVNSQKCIRVSGKHNDLEEVGHDTYHHTFFEMLGNWSFGDYYKKEAIQWAWELMTEVWKLPKEKLFATVYQEDNEAFELWPKITNISPDHVLKFGEKDNFWEMGSTGPCGPCSEIHIDLGEAFCDQKDVAGHHCAVNGDCGRYIELWNLVFIQYFRDDDGKLNPLKEKHVDTGMGFERIVSVLQGVYDNYKTDIFTPILEKIAELSRHNYQKSSDKAPFHVIADHIRMLTFSIADGGLPSNEGRGYVIRRILRRAARYGRKLGFKEPFLYRLVPTVVEILGEAFPEVIDREEHVQTIIRKEEESFNRTLDRGLEIFNSIRDKLIEEKNTVISGEDAFRLYDTFGFPLDLTRVLAEENGLKIDENGFEYAMEAQRKRAREAGKFNASQVHSAEWIELSTEAHSKFIGYDTLKTNAKIVKYREVENQLHIVLDKTPFYAESGGQIGDKGTLSCRDRSFNVIDTIKEGEAIVHIIENCQFADMNCDEIMADVHENLRIQTMSNHTATHLLHAALRNVLGEHVQQSGSLVNPERLRFDFSHFEKVTSEQIISIEKIVNEQIRKNIRLKISVEDIQQAKKMGAMALFGEKYGDRVRVVQVPGFSMELCGGTHVESTGQIGLFAIVNESSIASGIRRIEAVTGVEALKVFQKNRAVLAETAAMLNVPTHDVHLRLTQLLQEKKAIEKELKVMKSKAVMNDVPSLLEQAENINGIFLVIKEFEDMDIPTLKQLGDKLYESGSPVVGLFINHAGQKLNYVCVVADSLIKGKHLKAGDLVREVAKITGGGGGGRPHLATAGGNDPTKIQDAIHWLKNKLSE